MPSRIIHVFLSFVIFITSFANFSGRALAATNPSNRDSVEILRSACNDPKFVTYVEQKDKNGKRVYYRWIKMRGRDFDCQGVNARPLTKKLDEPTEAGTCTNCSHADKTVRSIQEMAAQVSLAPQCRPDPSFTSAQMGSLQCVGNAIKGAIGAIADLVKGLGYLLNVGGTWIHGKLFSKPEVHKTDNAMSKLLQFLRKLPRADFLAIIKNVGAWIAKMAVALKNNIWESAKLSANCKKWTPRPGFKNGIPFSGECLAKGPDWDCMSINQKAQSVCAVIGAIGSDIALMFVGGLTLAKLAGRSTNLVGALQRTRELAKIATANASHAVKVGGRAAAIVSDVTVGTVRIAGKVTALTTEMIMQALTKIDNLPGFKQWSRIQERAFVAGYKVGSTAGVKAIRGAEAASTIGKAAKEVSASEVLPAPASASSPTSTSSATPIPTDGGNLRLKSSSEVVAEIKADLTVPLGVTTRERFVADNKSRKVIPEQENVRFRERMKNPISEGRTISLRNTKTKFVNSTDGLGFDLSTAVTTTFIERASKKYEDLANKYAGDLEFTRFEGPNRLEIRIDPVGGKSLPPNIDAELANIYRATAAEQHLYLKENKLVRDIDEPVNWFKYGSGPDSHTANLTVRSNAGFSNQLSINRWEDRITQASLETVFIRAKEVHATIKKEYQGTSILDPASGRINPIIADIVNKADSPAEAVEKIKPFYTFVDDAGVPLPTKAAEAKADELMEYVEYSRNFGVEFYDARTPLSLKSDSTVCFGSDLCGQNGRNLSHNTSVFDGDFKSAMTAAVKSESSATDEFKSMMAATVSAREKTLTAAGYRVETMSSGDDIQTVVRNADNSDLDALPESVLRDLRDCTDGIVCMRDSYLPARIETRVGGVPKALDKQEVIDLTHKIEKELRVILQGPEYRKHNFSIEVSPKGQMTLQMSAPSNMSAADAARYSNNLRVAREKFDGLVDSKEPQQIMGLYATEPAVIAPPKIAVPYVYDVIGISPTATQSIGRELTRGYGKKKEETQPKPKPLKKRPKPALPKDSLN